MTANRIWIVGCIGFAALSAYLAFDRVLMTSNQYAGGVRVRTIAAQRDELFRLIPQLRPAINADQIEAAAKAAKLTIVRQSGSLRLMTGVEFVLAGNEVKLVRSDNFQ